MRTASTQHTPLSGDNNQDDEKEEEDDEITTADRALDQFPVLLLVFDQLPDEFQLLLVVDEQFPDELFLSLKEDALSLQLSRCVEHQLQWSRGHDEE